VQQLLASVLPRRMATGVSAGGLGQQGSSSATAVSNCRWLIINLKQWEQSKYNCRLNWSCSMAWLLKFEEDGQRSWKPAAGNTVVHAQLMCTATDLQRSNLRTSRRRPTQITEVVKSLGVCSPAVEEDRRRCAAKMAVSTHGEAGGGHGWTEVTGGRLWGSGHGGVGETMKMT
jgi:hypothetical protein